jgi:hypothetical protein
VSIVPTLDGSNLDFWRALRAADLGQESPTAVVCAGHMLSHHLQRAKAAGAEMQFVKEHRH